MIDSGIPQNWRKWKLGNVAKSQHRKCGLGGRQSSGLVLLNSSKERLSLPGPWRDKPPTYSHENYFLIDLENGKILLPKMDLLWNSCQTSSSPESCQWHQTTSVFALQSKINIAHILALLSTMAHWMVHNQGIITICFSRFSLASIEMHFGLTRISAISRTGNLHIGYYLPNVGAWVSLANNPHIQKSRKKIDDKPFGPWESRWSHLPVVIIWAEIEARCCFSCKFFILGTVQTNEQRLLEIISTLRHCSIHWNRYLPRYADLLIV